MARFTDLDRAKNHGVRATFPVNRAISTPNSAKKAPIAPLFWRDRG